MYNILYKRISKSSFFLIVIWLLLGIGGVHSQEATTTTASTQYSGMVIDQFGRPVSGVEVTMKNSSYKSITGEDGIFGFETAEGMTVVLSHPEYMVRELKLPIDVKCDKVFKIDIKEKVFKNYGTLDIPYGKTIEKDSYLGSQNTVYSDQLSTTLSSNVLGALSGRMAGFNVSQHKGIRSAFTDASSKSDFAGMMVDYGKVGYNDNTQYNLSLRGVGGPVIIVDGFQNDLLNIDMESIESVSLQKDALSSMFLGMRSSRGVLYITTKKPVNEGFKVSFTGKYGFQKPIKTPKALPAHQYAYLLNEALVNDGKSGIYSYDDFEKYRTGSDPYTHPNVNWYDEVLRSSAPIQSYNLNVTGGGKAAQYFVSLGYMSEDGLFRESSMNSYDTNSKYDRYMITSKINVDVTENLKMGATIVGRIEDGNQSGVGSSDIMKGVYNTPNNAYPIYNPNGSFGGSSAYTKNLMAQSMSSGYKSDNTRDGWGNITLDHDMAWLLEGLSARLVGSAATQSRSATIRSKQAEVFEFKPIEGGQPGEGNYDRFGEIKSQSNEFKAVSNYQYLFGQIAVDYKTQLGVHGISAGISADTKEVLDNYLLPEKPANINAYGKYDYGKKYFAEVAVSRSYFNRYAPSKKWGTFWATGLGWEMKKEDFLADVTWLDQLKLRGVFGQTGNGVSNSGYYTWRQAYNTVFTSWYPQGNGRNSTNLVMEVDGRLANPNVSWEKANKLNIGMDIALFKNRLIVNADYYRDRYSDLLQERGKSIELIGSKYPLENLGKNLMQGFEVTVTYQDNIGDFNYYVTGNWSRNQSEVLFMDEQYVQEDYMRRTGRSVGARYGLLAEGFFQSEEEIANSPVIAGYDIKPGDIKYKDLNNDGVVNEFDKTIIGGDKPTSYFGFNLGFEYKGFEFSALFQGAFNRDLYLSDAGQEFNMGFMASGSGYSQAYEHVLNRWTPETAETATYPRLTTINNGFGSTYNINPSSMDNSFWVRNGNFIRLKNISLAYTLPDTFSRNYLGGTKIKLFVTGQNIWTQSACKLVDPEVPNFGNYPMLRGFNTGVNIKF